MSRASSPSLLSRLFASPGQATSSPGGEARGLRKARGLPGFAAVMAAGLLLAGCSGSGGVFGLGESEGANSGPAVADTTVGAGAVKVGLLLPLSAQGGAGTTAQSLRNAAELAISEFGQNDIQLLVRDDRGTEAGARSATRAVLNDGAELVLGPLFAATTRAAGSVAKPANIPVISFSTDTSVAQPGVYLLSFLPESEVDRVIRFASQRGRRSFAALIPDNAYGKVVQDAFQRSVAASGGRVVAVETYAADRSNLQQAAQRIASQAGQADALFLPDNADTLPSIAQYLRAANLDTNRVKLLGTSLWNNPTVLATPGLQGGWFSAPDSVGFNAFAQRYRAKFGTEPTRIASLSYDAVLLASALVRTQGSQRFSTATLTNRAGFVGADGVFRFNANGTNDRALAVMEIRQNSAVVISAAPRQLQ
ncbi:penicillin-binding protein activator [Pseudochelatococcus contaminans]|uniref:Adhesin HecA-like repeat protein n=1 Tax=Pseudochelatococcus contaminans TaxID=1538103 RepID=A0A7W6EEF5_9HYPH|nr:adhesin HecA-like repeat protein [Pseudochelatococcus contaminans]